MNISFEETAKSKINMPWMPHSVRFYSMLGEIQSSTGVSLAAGHILGPVKNRKAEAVHHQVGSV